MSIITSLRDRFGNPARRAIPGNSYKITDLRAFNAAVWPDPNLTEDVKELDCVGRNDGGHPNFKPKGAASDTPPTRTTWMARGKPETYGLKYEGAK